MKTMNCPDEIAEIVLEILISSRRHHPRGLPRGSRCCATIESITPQPADAPHVSRVTVIGTSSELVSTNILKLAVGSRLATVRMRIPWNRRRATFSFPESASQGSAPPNNGNRNGIQAA